MNMDNAMAVTRSLNMYWYNTSAYDVVRSLFPTADISYLYIKENEYVKGLASWMSCLDYNHQEIFVQMALDKYLNEAMSWVEAHKC